jgi:hypothetical protein
VLLTVIEFRMSLFFFVSRDMYGTAAFHNRGAFGGHPRPQNPCETTVFLSCSLSFLLTLSGDNSPGCIHQRQCVELRHFSAYPLNAVVAGYRDAVVAI